MTTSKQYNVYAGSRGSVYSSFNLLFATACHHLSLVNALRCGSELLLSFNVFNAYIAADLFSIVSIDINDFSS